MHGQPGWHFWLIGFALTLAIEAPWVLSLLKAHEPRCSHRLAALLFANLLTHPLVWFFFPTLPVPHSWALAASELWAFAGEWWFYGMFVRGLSPKQAGTVSFAANLSSWSLGWLIIHYCGNALFQA